MAGYSINHAAVQHKKSTVIASNSLLWKTLHGSKCRFRNILHFPKFIAKLKKKKTMEKADFWLHLWARIFLGGGGWLVRDLHEIRPNLSSISNRNTSNGCSTSNDLNRLEWGDLASNCGNAWWLMRSDAAQCWCTLTCRAQASGSLLRLRGSVSVLLASLPPSGAGGADVHFTDFEEGHHERLLLQRSVTSYKAHILRADALPCFRRHRVGIQSWI